MQPVLDKNDVFLKKVQKCFLQVSPPLHTYSNLFNLFQNAISPKVCVSTGGAALSHRASFGSLGLWPGCRAQPAQHSSSWAGTAEPQGRHCSEHMPHPSLAAGQLARAQFVCNPRQNFSLNIKSLSLLLQTPHTGTKYTTGYYSALTYRLSLLK